jgi:hypothetical protein
VNWILFGVTFATSFGLYFLMRRFDVWSTKEFAKYVDMQKHEVNPLVNALLRRGWTLDKVMTFTLFLFGIPIALFDASLNTYILFGVPVLAFLMGCFHMVAAASNTGGLQRLRRMSKEEINEEEADWLHFASSVRKASWVGKVRMVVEREAFGFWMTIMFAFAYGLLYYSVGVAGIVSVLNVFHSHGYPLYSFFGMGWLLCLALLGYYPLRAASTVVMTMRYSKLAKKDELSGSLPTEPSVGWMDVTVAQLEDALKLAKANGVNSVRLSIGTKEAA